ncbi:hypothetical protein Rhopal_001925-T1 [Rhodotorula paludigena]|uniref:Carboxylesterase type B domain-containing protein n=1 Tax=Rhodotorula paludigena TaxID=86838 RepID=A0AAV5GIC7_9BASI|nr:hypothetical protein Rhopal_001925-T1 [Rhodotorula paludigena]
MLPNFFIRFCAAIPLLGLLASSCNAAPTTLPDTQTISTPHGDVTGAVIGSVRRFTVPFAAPPTGRRRFLKAVPVDNWTSLNGTQLPSKCFQTNEQHPEGEGDEDCLYMNIYSRLGPQRQNGQRDPVLVWIHGGSFHSGGTSDLDAGIRSFVGERVIVVSLQYRLGMLGWLKWGTRGFAGNQGLTDVIEALKMIKSDISAYGGDPSSITIAGQSSGAELIKTLLVTPSAANLFERAILQSAPLDFVDQSASTASAVGSMVGTEFGCAPRAVRYCVQRQSLDRIAQVQNIVIDPSQTLDLASANLDFTAVEPFRPHVDGELVTRDFRQVIASGDQLENPSRPLLFSTVKNEGCNGVRKQLAGFPEPAWNQIAPGVLVALFPTRFGLIQSSGLYDLSAEGDDLRDELSQLTTDWYWVCPNQQTALRSAAKSGYSGNVFLAEFDMGIPRYPEDSILGCDRGVGHEDDIFAVFGNSLSANYSAAQKKLILEVQERWAAFVRRGSPNLNGIPEWPAVAASKGDLNVWVFGADSSKGTSAVRKTQRTEACAVYTTA